VRNYIATPDDIAALSRQLMGAQEAAEQSRQTYLRSVAGTTIAELGMKPRAYAVSKAPRLKPEEIDRQLTALETVHDRFYGVILKVVSEKLPAGKEKAQELNRRTNFARTSLRAIRNFIKAGNDITKVVVAKITKRSLAVEHAVRPVSPGRLKRRAETQSKALVATLLALSETDKPSAIGEIQLLIGQLTSQLTGMGIHPVTNPQTASDEFKPFRTKGRVFIPVTQTQVIRQRAQPS